MVQKMARNGGKTTNYQSTSFWDTLWSPFILWRQFRNLHFFQKCCHFRWLCFDYSKNDNTFERNEECATIFLKWTDFDYFFSFRKIRIWKESNKKYLKKTLGASQTWWFSGWRTWWERKWRRKSVKWARHWNYQKYRWQCW